MKKITLYRTGEIVRDIGIISFYNYLKEIDINDELNIMLTENHLKFNEFEIDKLLECLEKDYPTGIPYIGNSPRFGNINGPKNKRFYKNLEDILKISFEIIKDFDNQKNILKEYEPDKTCKVCNTYLSVKKHYSIMKEDLVKREEDKTLYTFSGAQNNSFNNYSNSSLNVCFICEFLNIFFLLYIDKNKIDMLSFCDGLSSLNYINHKLMINEKLYSGNSLYLKLAQLNSQYIRLYEIRRDPKKGLILRFSNSLNTKYLIRNLRLLNIINEYHFSESKANELKYYIKILMINNNFEAVEKTLLFHLISNDLDNNTKERILKNNVYLYTKFLKEGGLAMSENKFAQIGLLLGSKIEEEKKKNNIAFRLAHLLRSDAREQLHIEILHLLVSYQIAIPEFFNEGILKTDSIQLHYNIGKLIEMLMKKETIDNE